MTADRPKRGALLSVAGTELLADDTRERYRQKLARITLDSMVQFVGLLDEGGTVLEINRVALDAVGVQLSDVEGKPFWTTFWWQVSEEVNATLRDSIRRAAQGEFVRWDAEIYGRAGGKETIIIDASLMPVKDERGNVVFITAEGRDITEKKANEREIARQREELAQLDKLKTQFFANISHEFRTPLTLMMGPLEDALAEPASADDANRSRLALAHRNSLRLLKLVNTLLDFSRIEAGRVEASYEPVDLAAVTAELASVFRSAVERAGLELVVDCAPLPEPVYVDREMWEKIVLNLISNAFKFTFEGRIEVSLRPGDRVVRLTIRDTGTGIPAAELPRLFERFHRVRGARGRSYEGSGIGLALVQELAKLHGGTVSIASEVDRGSSFTVTIPLGRAHLPADRIEVARTLASTALRADAFVEELLRWAPAARHTAQRLKSGERAAAMAERSASTAPDDPATARIVLADDNADMRDYVRRLLGDYEVEAVADGVLALDAVRARRPDLVLSDVMMPRMDGFELLRELRADPLTRDVPVILISARAGEESRIEGLAAGADDYVIKPFSARELLARVSSQIQLARLRGEYQRALRERGEALEEADRRKDEFLAILAHELRNPLAPIRHALQVVRRSADRSTREQARNVIERQLDHMVRLVDDLLDVSRITQGKLELRKECQPLALVINSALEASRPLIERAGHGITIALPAQPILVDADLVRLAQVLSNLLTNSAKYMERGGHIWLSAEQRAGEVLVSIKDQGIGIEPGELTRVFDMFSQVDDARGRSQGGLGIGLTLVKQLVEMHGGSVEARSGGRGRGSEFIVRLPTVLEPPEPRPKDAPAIPGIPLRVLIVDDNADSADSLAMLLRLMDHDTRTAYDGREGAELAERLRPDVVLLDIGLPVLDGYGACRRIREQPWGKDPVLVALTGWAQEDDRRRSREAGFDHHLVKPVDVDELLRILGERKRSPAEPGS